MQSEAVAGVATAVGPMGEDEALWKVEDVLRYMNIPQKSRTAIYELIEDGLPSFKIGGRRRFNPTAVRVWVAGLAA